MKAESVAIQVSYKQLQNGWDAPPENRTFIFYYFEWHL